MSDQVLEDDRDVLGLSLDAVRLLGTADAAAVERRFGVPRRAAAEPLLDAEACVQVPRVGQEPVPAWVLAHAGRAYEERLLAADLDAPTDLRWDDAVLAELASLGRRPEPLGAGLPRRPPARRRPPAPVLGGGGPRPAQ